MNSGAIEIRRSRDQDRPGIVTLLRHALGWADDNRYERLFAWKHRDNPFGASPAWVALDGNHVVGLRILMRWQFERGSEVVHAVRAVDTATHPEYQGRGIFTGLTRRALDELAADGTAFVFNTPNDQSRPGYLKMGWRDVGRLPIVARLTSSLTGGLRMLRARTAAERWSAPTTAGVAASDVLDDKEAVAQLLAARPSSAGLRTNASPAYLAWRYASPLVDYRAMVAPGGIARGVALFRVRQRGRARECALDDVIVAGGSRAAVRDLVRNVTRAVDADYLVAIDPQPVAPGGLVRIPRLGPRLTWRAVTPGGMPPLAQWDLRLGDVELF